MSAGRKTSVQRHIDNPNIHNGDGRAMPFAEHSSALEGRVYRSRPAPRITSSGPTDAENLLIRIEKEVENEIVREVARRIFKSIYMRILILDR